MRQAQQLAAWGQLNLVTLHHRSRPIAFEYGWQSKYVYFSPKVGFDETCQQYSPGQLLRRLLIERFQQQPGVRLVDFLGPSSAATARWATHQYPIHRLVASPDRAFGQSPGRGISPRLAPGA